MPEDPLIDKLTRLTPAKPALDRDELLFRAGRALARPSRWWKAAAAALAVTQTATLGLWLADRGPQPVARSPLAPSPADPSPPPSSDVRLPPLVWRPDPTDDPPPRTVDLVPAGPPLTVLSAYRDPGTF